MTQDRASITNIKNESDANTSKSQTNNNKRRNTPKKPKKITPTYLHNSGLYYLERFSSSAENFRKVMMRKVKRSCMVHTDQNYAECATMVNQLVEKFVSVGLLDDSVYTRSKVNSLRRRGKSKRAIQAYLKSKGLNADLVEKSLEDHDAQIHNDPQEAELEAALTFARKKRLGPFGHSNKEEYQKELGRMARAGFNYETSRRVLQLNEDEELYNL